MATDENKTIEILEEKYKGYKVVEPIKIRFSDHIAGAYIYARMIKKPTVDRKAVKKC